MKTDTPGAYAGPMLVVRSIQTRKGPVVPKESP